MIHGITSRVIVGAITRVVNRMRGTIVARDTVLVTTLAAVPALLVIAALLAPAA